MNLTNEQIETGEKMRREMECIANNLAEMIRRDRLVERANTLVTHSGNSQLISDWGNLSYDERIREALIVERYAQGKGVI